MQPQMQTAIAYDIDTSAGSSLPDLHCPFPSLTNIHTAQAHNATLRWADRFGLLEPGDVRAQQAAQLHSWLVGGFFPRARLPQFQLLCDFTSWLFWHDDVCDETALADDPSRLEQQFAQLFGLMMRAADPRPGNAFDASLVDLRDRFEALAPSCVWWLRFATSLEEYFEACVREAEDRREGGVPTVRDFIPLRRCAGGMWIYLDFVEFVNEQTLPIAVRQNRDVQRLRRITTNVACWTNDIYSLAKELRSGQVHNLVISLWRERGGSLEQAMETAAAYCDAEVHRFQGIARKLPSFGNAADAIVDRYLDGMKALMRGNLDWSRESGRYRAASSAEDVAALPRAVLTQIEQL